MSDKIYRLRVIYEKKSFSKFISGKNFAKIIERCLRRLDLPLKFTEGFNPHPRISFGPTLPVNIEGEAECLDIYFETKIDEKVFLEKINKVLPEGTLFKKAYWVPFRDISLNSMKLFAVYKIEKNGLNEDDLKEFGDVEVNGRYIKVVVMIKGFKHKKLLEKVGNRKIIRQILWKGIKLK